MIDRYNFITENLICGIKAKDNKISIVNNYYKMKPLNLNENRISVNGGNGRKSQSNYQDMNLRSVTLNNKYKVGHRIGFGSFGDIYLGRDVTTDKQVAIKFTEYVPKAKVQLLELEYRLYKDIGQKEGIPEVHWYGIYPRYAVLVMDSLGPSLDYLFNFCSERFSVETICELSIQMLNLLEHVHGKGIIHRDIKPSNFLMGSGDSSNIVHIIDFGLARHYYKPNTNKHILYREDRTLCGTIRYVSLNVHLGIEPSRRDDLESLGYMCIQFAKGKLPWQNLGLTDRMEKQAMTYKLKESTSLKSLCLDCPAEFLTYMAYVRGLEFSETPNYEYLRDLFRNILRQKYLGKPNICSRMEFDWVVKNQERVRNP